MLATRTLTTPQRLNWRDALALWLWERFSGLLHPACHDTEIRPDLRQSDRNSVGRRYPIRADRARRMYCAAD